MNKFSLFQNGKIANLLVEEEALPGVKRVARTICQDLEKVTGTMPVQIGSLREVTQENLIFVGTCAHSSLPAAIGEGVLSLDEVRGKRESYLMQLVADPFKTCPQIKKALFIIGSDKRGTIYGMFRLSEMCGVSPLIFWGDAAPLRKEEVILEFERAILSKEPSVLYRGFFINDEWPAFGKWCQEHYGGVNAKAYDKIFELLLRLKGNYLWPAMWRSSFWEDGPELEAAKLADEYGVIMGASHHEPLCRAGVEWQNQYRQYGEDNTWSFITNAPAITEFWRDGLKRSKCLENVITIGMRGENDSLLLKEGASLQDNIEVVKKAITVQNKLIRQEISEHLDEVPRMFAIYKEVEDFFFGSADCEGLRGFDELENVILLLSDDNYGGLRALPQPADKAHRGGYGIYYHFDYHGAPYSYEWLNHTNLAKAWEQLTVAYEYGVRKMWIVNVGDIKGNEYPLSFFLDLAYDYDKWGISHLNSAADYTRKWVGTNFPLATETQSGQIEQLLKDYTTLTTLRIPESLNENVYKDHYHETERMEAFVKNIENLAASLREQLPAAHREAYDSMIYYPVIASANILHLGLLAARNKELAARGVLAANLLTAQIGAAAARDREIIAQFHAMAKGKWNHMMDSAHTGFRGWDDNDWTYPAARTIYPIPCGKTVVSFRGGGIYHLGHHWQDKGLLRNEEMLRPDVNEILLDLDSRGDVDFQYKVNCPVSWLSFSETEGQSCLSKTPRITLAIRCDRSKLIGEECARIRLDFYFQNGEKRWSEVEIKAGNRRGGYEPGAFMETEGYVCIDAASFSKKEDVQGMGWRIVPGLGRTGDAIKTFPVTRNWISENICPYVEYRFIVRRPGRHTIRFYLSPRNPMTKGGTIRGAYAVNGESAILFDTVPEGYFTEWQNTAWSHGVTDNVRRVDAAAEFQEGLNSLRFYAADPHVILEHIVIFHESLPLQDTHLAPPESYRFGISRLPQETADAASV